ncbi:uncharacterized protein METZ01_LOCUS296322, partial [marine metagenome]
RPRSPARWQRCVPTTSGSPRVLRCRSMGAATGCS